MLILKKTKKRVVFFFAFAFVFLFGFCLEDVGDGNTNGIC